MANLYIDALAIAIRSRPRLQPSAELPRRNDRRQIADMIARAHGIAAERMSVRQPIPGDASEAADCATACRALEALGPSDHDQTLFQVRSGPVIDAMRAPLASTVHAVGWTGDDVGVSHLEEHGGTLVFSLLSWAVPEDQGATVVIVDDPAYVDVQAEKPSFAAVALRLARAGDLRVVACGAVPLGARALPAQARHARALSGPGACGAWLSLYAGLSSQRIEQGEVLSLRTTGGGRQGYLLLEACRPCELKMTKVLLED